MKILSIPSSVIILALILLLMFCLSCNEKENTQNIFVSHLIYTSQSTENEFLLYLQDKYIPIWQRLKDRNILDELSVFKFKKIDSTTTDKTQCNILILAQLVPKIDAHDYLNLENFRVNSISKDSLLFKIIRTEVLGYAPNAYFPALNPKNAVEINYLIEFIAVKDSGGYVTQYNNLVTTYFGPLNGELIKEGKLYSIYMMETLEVVFQIDSSLPWNQIHISGDFSDYKDLDWDSLYTNSFRRIFSCELDSVWALLPPTLSSSFDCEGQLIEKLHIK